MTEKDTARDPRCRTTRWGIDLAYQDAVGEWHEATSETEQAILAAMGVDPQRAAAEYTPSPLIVRCGDPLRLPGPATVILESKETVSVDAKFSDVLPLGYHRIQFDGSSDVGSLIVAPSHCWLPPDLTTWGWSVQLYAARSRQSWGIGDFNDLKQLARWSANSQDAGMMLLNPLSAVAPVMPIQCSPYYPASRLFLSPLWLHLPSLPGVRTLGGQFDAIAREGEACNASRLIDRNRIFEIKMRALELLWPTFKGNAAFNSFCAERGQALHSFAIFCALAERHRSGWHTWPAEFRRPENLAVQQFSEAFADRVRFHKWVQWLLDCQLAQSADSLALMQDLPIGVDPDGADAWVWQDVLAHGIGVGAPPDEFNTQGQNWGLPPFVPHRLRAANYGPLVETVRAAFRHCGGLRIDHVMGLFRLFWIPNGMPAVQGAYVRYAEDEMLAIVALESHRAKAFVVGEDLGTVENMAREKLARSRILSYRLLWFEKQQPESYPEDSLAAVTTHDLPTVAGLWNGSDLARQRELGLKPNDAGTTEIKNRLAEWIGRDKDCSASEVIADTYRLLGHAPSRIVTACLDDALAVVERPNIPATTQDQNPNWSIALPKSIEEIMQSELASRIATSLRCRGKRSLESASTFSSSELSNEPSSVPSTVWD